MFNKSVIALAAFAALITASAAFAAGTPDLIVTARLGGTAVNPFFDVVVTNQGNAPAGASSQEIDFLGSTAGWTGAALCKMSVATGPIDAGQMTYVRVPVSIGMLLQLTSPQRNGKDLYFRAIADCFSQVDETVKLESFSVSREDNNAYAFAGKLK